MKGWITKDEPLALRLTVFGVCALLFVAAFGQAVQVDEQPASWGHAIFVTIFLLTVYGLLRMQSWARVISVVTLWLIVILMTVGLINPYMASDLMSAGITPPTVSSLLMIIVPIVVVLLVLLHFLGKYKGRFS